MPEDQVKTSVTTCCDKWWSGLTETQKEWIHYYFHDIKEHKFLHKTDVHDQHESRFTLEGTLRL